MHSEYTNVDTVLVILHYLSLASTVRTDWVCSLWQSWTEIGCLRSISRTFLSKQLLTSWLGCGITSESTAALCSFLERELKVKTSWVNKSPCPGSQYDTAQEKTDAAFKQYLGLIITQYNWNYKISSIIITINYKTDSLLQRKKNKLKFNIGHALTWWKQYFCLLQRPRPVCGGPRILNTVELPLSLALRPCTTPSPVVLHPHTEHHSHTLHTRTLWPGSVWEVNERILRELTSLRLRHI